MVPGQRWWCLLKGAAAEVARLGKTKKQSSESEDEEERRGRWLWFPI